MASTQGQVPGPYSISNLLRGEEHSYESRISDLLSKRSSIPMAPGRGDCFLLPTASFCRDLGIGTAGGGGNLVTDGVERVAQAARPTLVLEAMGAQRVEVSSIGAVDFPIWKDDQRGGWLAEGAAAPSLGSTFRTVTAAGKMAAARLGMSRRMLLHVEALEQAVLAEVEAAARATIERGFIAGTNTASQPMGLLATHGTGTQSFTAATPTWAELVSMIETAADADADLNRCAYLLHPSDLADLLKAESFTGAGAIVTHDGTRHRIAGFPVYTSTHQVEGKVFFMDASTIRTVYWGAPQLVADKYSNGKSIGGNLELILLNLCDIVVNNPKHIVIGSN